MSEPRVCIIGAGGLSSRRIYPNVAPAGARLVGVCDLDPAKAQRNARLYGGKPYQDLAAMLSAERPDGVIICVGPAAHAKLASQVLELGYPVYTEKPPAERSSDALVVARLAAKRGLLCMTAFKKRYAAAYQRARQWVQQFDPADLYSLSIDYASDQYAPGDPAKTFLLDFCIHAIDLVGFLFGDVRRAFAFAKGPDAYAVSLQFACEAVGSMNLTDGRSFSVPTEEVELTARGGNFMTVHNSSCWRVTAAGKPVEWREPPTFTSAGGSGLDTGHLAELIAFVQALTTGPTPPSQVYESYKSMVLYEAIAESAATGQVVDVRYEAI